MARLCSFQVVTGVNCGCKRGFTDCVALNRCDSDINSHLQKHRLSTENVCEKDLILARAGLLELTEKQVKNMTVCPAHRFTLGKYWHSPKTCQNSKCNEKFSVRSWAVRDTKTPCGIQKHHGKKTAGGDWSTCNKFQASQGNKSYSRWFAYVLALKILFCSHCIPTSFSYEPFHEWALHGCLVWRLSETRPPWNIVCFEYYTKLTLSKFVHFL